MVFWKNYIHSDLAVSPNIGEKKVKGALKKTVLKSKLSNIAELFTEGERENFSVLLIDQLFDLFKTDNIDVSKTSEYIIDMNVLISHTKHFESLLI